MNVIPSDPLSAPHLLQDPRRAFHQEQHSMSTRKRKASEEPDHDRMSTSPTNSPSTSSRTLPHTRTMKRTRTNLSGGRPLPLPRLLQTLSPDEMRSLLQTICEERAEVKQDVVARAPRPSIHAALAVLDKYEREFTAAFPFGNRPSSEYTYNRVRQHMLDLLEAVRDFVPGFLPPQEAQTAVSLSFLDAATNIVHRLPDWDNFQHHRYKQDAYDDIARAWLLVLREAQKSSGVYRLQFGGWETKLSEHNQKSGGRLEEANTELRKALGFMQAESSSSAGMDDRLNIRQQLMSGTYGQQLGVGQQW